MFLSSFWLTLPLYLCHNEIIEVKMESSMKKFLNICILFGSLALTACNGGGGSNGGSDPTPTPSPTPTGIGPLQVEVVQQTQDLGTVNWIDLRKVGSTTMFKLKFTNTNSVPVGFYGDSILGESTETVNFLSPTSEYNNLYFTNNSPVESTNCAYYQLLNGYTTTESEIHAGTVYNKKVYHWQNANSMLQPGQSCYYNVYGYSFPNETESDIFSIKVGYLLHNNNYNTSSWYVSNYDRFYESNLIYMKIVKLIAADDSLSKTIFYNDGTMPSISLDGNYAVTTSTSGSEVTVTRYNVSYNNSLGLQYTSPVSFVVPNCNYVGRGSAASLSPLGDRVFIGCSYLDPQWVQVWSIQNGVAAYQSYVNLGSYSLLSGFDYQDYWTPVMGGGSIYRYTDQLISTGLTNTPLFYTSQINSDGTFIQVSNDYQWQCQSISNGVIPLTGLSDSFKIYNSQFSFWLTIQNKARLQIELQSPIVPIKQYSDGNTFPYQPGMTGLAPINTGNGNCYIESANFINTTTYGVTSYYFSSMFITNNYVAIPDSDSSGKTAILVTSIDNLVNH